MPIYRHELVVRALAALPADVILVTSSRGAWPETVEAVTAEAERAGVSDRLVVLPGIPHDEMPAYLNAADVVVSIPVTDGTPVTLLETLACGRPIVVGDLPSIREWSDGLHPDLVVAEPTVSSVTEALCRALELSDAERDDLATRGRAVVVKRADHERNMLLVEERYRAMARMA